MKKGDKVRFKVVQYTANRGIKVETDEVKEGRCIGHDAEYLVVRVGSMKLPYLVHPDSVIQEAMPCAENVSHIQHSLP